jgi:hypothetical protein
MHALGQGIKTVKMGLTDSETIRGRVVAGHYHPAFGYLVKSRAFYLSVIQNVEAASMDRDVRVRLNNRDIPHLLGYKRSNVRKLEEKGILISWEKAEKVEGYFDLTCGSKCVKGSIFDICQPQVGSG